MVADVLCIRNLRVESTTGAVLVDDIDLTLARGEVLGLIGESGAGKSTVGLAALTFGRPGCRIVAGQILIHGQDALTLSARDRRQLRGVRVAYIAQSAAAAFNPAMTLLDQICEGPIRHGLMSRHEARARAIETFRVLELPDPEHFGERYPHQVSGGQLQRAMTAMALSCRPDVLVLDEPTTALDVTTQIEVLAHLKELIALQGTAALYISHDLALVAQIADRIMVLRHGKAVESGPARQLLEAPRTDYARALVAERSVASVQSRLSPDTGSEPLLVVDNISVRFGRHEAVRAARFAVGRGETVAVVGESGSGKTTLAMAICGKVGLHGGRVRFQGADLAPGYPGRSREALRRIQLIFQLPEMALNPRQTVARIVARPVEFYFGLRGAAARDRALELLEAVGLGGSLAQRLAGQLSGGQRQRVCIARALAARPDLIICDEVTAALDPLVAEEILKLLQRLQQQLALSFLFITHDLVTVRRIAHRVLVMLRGEIVASGESGEVFASNHPYVERLVAATPEPRIGWLDEVLHERSLIQSPHP